MAKAFGDSTPCDAPLGGADPREGISARPGFRKGMESTTGTPKRSVPPKSRRPNVLLVFDPRLEESAAMLRGVVAYEQAHGSWNLFHDDEARAETEPCWLRHSDWDGVISRHTTLELATACADRGVPLVDLNDSPVFPGVSKIRPANECVGRLGAEHLLSAGFRNLGFSGFANECWALERARGFTEAVLRAGVQPVLNEANYPGRVDPVWSREQQTELADWLRSLPQPAAVMACNDLRALQVLEAAQSIGLLVPDQLAVLGANNDTLRCELADPPLSSVSTNPVLAGRRAAEALEQLMGGGSTSSDELRIEPEGVIARRSTDVTAVSDPRVAVALRYIRAHACEGINVDQVLQAAAMSRAQIEKKFRQHLGRTPQAEIRRVQMARIRQLLTDTDLPLKYVAELAGFDYMEYMCAVFKRQHGMPPGAFRERQRQRRPASCVAVAAAVRGGLARAS